ncbi:GAF domain-containing protein [Desulfatibacillum alkenivorans DSM 16219]|jgi:response regulator RpfG family c-di-GMP phosphodiesterase|uniref:GAF domain-containing protein n=1 Tax=Desulfatibacillum alkenivorans DSM 16219 TaxID=1121393 RepID=A0A1M6E345_9BACT|nr:HD domain-containing phosphohydrolase [Desulfatibacillum alkenivorans]SHI79927.1 GAF domain-containing protein [Desulfatibacillum alkenivorans DSM 16219]
MMRENEKIQALATLGADLNEVHDLDILMERILARARKFVNADAGSIYIAKNGALDFTYTQNDTLRKRLPKGEKLIYSTFSIPIDQKSVAGYAAATGRPLNLEDAHAIDPSKPYGFNKKFDETSGYRTRSVLAIPMKNMKDEVMGVLQIINAQGESGEVISFTQEDEQMMSHFAGIASVALVRAQMTRAILLRMIKMAEMRDPKETGAHVNRVGGYSLELYERWAARRNISTEEIESTRDSIRMAAMLHDVGKVAISDLILKKPGRFTPEEFEIMKQHAVLGARLFAESQSDFDDAARIVALNHHERWDGKGYPGHVDYLTGEPLEGYAGPNGMARGKKGEEIPILGRIVALADVFDALCSKRVYKEAWTDEETFKVLQEGRGTQFDPELVDIFFSCVDVIKSIRERYRDDEE